jgi:hypothetical protein
MVIGWIAGIEVCSVAKIKRLKDQRLKEIRKFFSAHNGQAKQTT